MRIAVDGTDEVASRTARVLYAESSVEHIGFMQPEMAKLGKRSGRIGDLATYDVIVSTGTTPVNDLVARASVLSIPLVIWQDEPGLHRGRAASTVVVGANLGSALAPALASHPSVAVNDSDTVTVAWTEPGKPYRRGEGITFPEPVGSVWAQERGAGRFVARTSQNWGGAVVIARGPAGERIVGVSDHAPHLEAITLAATTTLAGSGACTTGIEDATELGLRLLERAMDMELDIAVWHSAP